jgi:hypothetical protein
MKRLTAADATAVNPPRRARRRPVKTNPPRPRIITGRGWVA